MKNTVLITFLISVAFLACKKGPGVGGRATVLGKVFATNYSAGYIKTDSGYIGGIKVYIKYGDENGVGDNVETDNNGNYRFDFLRQGKYTFYVFSKVLQNNTIDTSYTQTIDITSKKEEKILPDFKINTLKN
jgi:hypothetical protein